MEGGGARDELEKLIFNVLENRAFFPVLALFSTCPSLKFGTHTPINIKFVKLAGFGGFSSIIVNSGSI